MAYAVNLPESYENMSKRLMVEVCTAIFFKKNGEIRTLLGTKDGWAISLEYPDRVNWLLAHEERNTKSNGNIAIFDLIIGEPRSFNIGRLVAVYSHGRVIEETQIKEIKRIHYEFADNYERQIQEIRNLEDIE